MSHYNLALIGFGNVGRALSRLLIKKQDELVSKYDLNFSVTGIATRSHGIAIDPKGLDIHKALTLVESHRMLNELSKQPIPANQLEFIRECGAQVLFENSPVNHLT